MTYEVTFTNGEEAERYDTYEQAKESVLARWPDAEIGHDGDLDGFGDRTLFWLSEEDSENDDGARALGSIREAGK